MHFMGSNVRYIIVTFFQSAKVFVKKMMQYVPTIGWAWRFSDTIFLNRKWEQDKTVMETQIKEFFDYPYPVWVSTFIPC